MNSGQTLNTGIAIRPMPGETLSGDQASAWSLDTSTLMVALVDGLGHGQAAFEAARRCLNAIDAAKDRPLAAIIDACHCSLAGTRGAAMALACVNAVNQTVDLVSIGNILTLLTGGPKKRFFETAGIVGEPGAVAPRIQSTRFVPGQHLLIMASDGVDPKHDLASYQRALFPSLPAMAGMMLDRSAMGSDDASLLLVG